MEAAPQTPMKSTVSDAQDADDDIVAATPREVVTSTKKKSKAKSSASKRTTRAKKRLNSDTDAVRDLTLAQSRVNDVT